MSQKQNKLTGSTNLIIITNIIICTWQNVHLLIVETHKRSV